MASKRKDHLVDTALDMFYRNGFHATGIDTILQESGVAKMTLYNHFKSKDDLIVAVLRRRQDEFLGWLRRTTARFGDTPRSRLLGIFDALKVWFSNENFRGCLFIHASSEFEGMNGDVHVACSEFKAQVLSFIRELSVAAGIRDSARLSRQIYLLYEGATVAAQISGRTEAADEAKIAASALIDHAIRQG